MYGDIFCIGVVKCHVNFEFLMDVSQWKSCIYIHIDGPRGGGGYLGFHYPLNFNK